jgi:hypothetical protein
MRMRSLDPNQIHTPRIVQHIPFAAALITEALMVLSQDQPLRGCGYTLSVGYLDDEVFR